MRYLRRLIQATFDESCHHKAQPKVPSHRGILPSSQIQRSRPPKPTRDPSPRVSGVGPGACDHVVDLSSGFIAAMPDDGLEFVLNPQRRFHVREDTSDNNVHPNAVLGVKVDAAVAEKRASPA